MKEIESVGVEVHFNTYHSYSGALFHPHNLVPSHCISQLLFVPTRVT